MTSDCALWSLWTALIVASVLRLCLFRSKEPYICKGSIYVVIVIHVAKEYGFISIFKLLYLDHYNIYSQESKITW